MAVLDYMLAANYALSGYVHMGHGTGKMIKRDKLETIQRRITVAALVDRHRQNAVAMSVGRRGRSIAGAREFAIAEFDKSSFQRPLHIRHFRLASISTCFRDRPTFICGPKMTE